MKNILVGAWLAFFAGCSSSCGPAELKTSSEDTQTTSEEDRSWLTWDECGHKPGENPCNFSLQNQHGENVELYDHYGKVIIIDLSAMWCGVCANIAPKGESLSLKYGSEDFVWLTLLLEDESGNPPDQDDLLRWSSMFGISGHVLAGDRALIDPNAETGYPVSGWPTIVAVDREMKIYNGVNGWSETLVTSWIDFLIE